MTPPPNSLGDNPPPPPPPSSNPALPPSSSLRPPPLPSTNIPRPSICPLQSNITKKGEKNQESLDHQMQMVVIAPTPSQPEMSETGRPNLDFGDQSETDDYDGFLYIGFMPPAAVPLNVIYPDSYFEGEIPQGTNNEIEAGQINARGELNTRNRKASFSGRTHDTEAESSSTAGDPSTPPNSKKNKLIFYLNEFAKLWSLTIDEVREVMIENNVAIQQKKEARKKKERMSCKLAQAFAYVGESSNDQVKKIKFFNNSLEKQHRVSDLNDRIIRRSLEMF
ncbi:unnamed protein product [Lactuca saligna]|uniref:Uncharacterized protein n=1 Tax=Lactuca saligna TaxID=75948 RepID=A0AA36EB15_LACSI|nr:unnamed protein product [Lactuca saligna]